MLQSIRNASQTGLGKIVLSGIFTFLSAGVAIVGVEEFFRGGASTTVATVGKTQDGKGWRREEADADTNTADVEQGEHNQS